MQLSAEQWSTGPLYKSVYVRMLYILYVNIPAHSPTHACSQLAHGESDDLVQPCPLSVVPDDPLPL